MEWDNEYELKRLRRKAMREYNNRVMYKMRSDLYLISQVGLEDDVVIASSKYPEIFITVERDEINNAPHVEALWDAAMKKVDAAVEEKDSWVSEW